MLEGVNDSSYHDGVMARRDMGELVGITEIAERFEVARGSVVRWQARPDFPEPVAHLTAGKIWRTADVDEWAAKTLPLPGTRPDRQPKR